MGVAVGDYDGDGYQDIFITGYEKCVLYHNNGDGTFTDVTSASGINPPDGPRRRSGSITARTGNWTSSSHSLWIIPASELAGKRIRTAARWRTLLPSSVFTVLPGSFPPPHLTSIVTTAGGSSPTLARRRDSPTRSGKSGVLSSPTSTTTATWTSSRPTIWWRISCL